MKVSFKWIGRSIEQGSFYKINQTGIAGNNTKIGFEKINIFANRFVKPRGFRKKVPIPNIQRAIFVVKNIDPELIFGI